MWLMRSVGYVGSTGTYAAPVLAMAQTASTDSTLREIPMATTSPGPTPRSISSLASREDAASSSA
ncbi:hypothetical protein NG2371_06913 [Nocardia gamkensis]|nr:hypothetical protein [Nocardia gamkensis]